MRVLMMMMNDRDFHASVIFPADCACYLISERSRVSFQLLSRNMRGPSSMLLHCNEVLKPRVTREIIDEPLRVRPGFGQRVILSGAVNFGAIRKIH